MDAEQHSEKVSGPQRTQGSLFLRAAATLLNHTASGLLFVFWPHVFASYGFQGGHLQKCWKWAFIMAGLSYGRKSDTGANVL